MARTFALFVAAALAFGACVAAQQTRDVEATITGCLQRAPASFVKEGRFVLMNASNSPLGGESADRTPPEPARSTEPLVSRPGESDARQETGGVSYLLVGFSDLDARIGQRVEVTGTIGAQVKAPPTIPTTQRPFMKIQVKRVRAIAPAC